MSCAIVIMPKKYVTYMNPNRGSVLMIAAIAMIMTLSMHGEVLAVAAPVAGAGYHLTVNVPSNPGTSTVVISVTTANGYTNQVNVATAGGASWIFNIPSNEGNWVRVCVSSQNSSAQNCNTYNTTGTDMSVSLSPPSNTNGNYIYGGHHGFGKFNGHHSGIHHGSGVQRG
jgi:hypothetical protein